MPKKDKSVNSVKKERMKKVIKEETSAVEKINEKSINDTPKDVIKKRLNKIYFEPLIYNNKHYSFIYDDFIKLKSADDTVKNYILNLKKKIWSALNLRKIIKDFEMAIYLNDNNANDN